MLVMVLCPTHPSCSQRRFVLMVTSPEVKNLWTDLPSEAVGKRANLLVNGGFNEGSLTQGMCGGYSCIDSPRALGSRDTERRDTWSSSPPGPHHPSSSSCRGLNAKMTLTRCCGIAREWGLESVHSASSPEVE